MNVVKLYPQARVIMNFSQTIPPSTILGEKEGERWRSNKYGKKLIHIYMLTFLRNPAVISKWIINQLKEDFFKLLKIQSPLPFKFSVIDI